MFKFKEKKEIKYNIHNTKVVSSDVKKKNTQGYRY